MSGLLAGKTALVAGVANRWSIAYSIAQAFRREGATLLLTYQGERLKSQVEELGAELGAARILNCDVTNDAELAALVAVLEAEFPKLDIVVHSIAFANDRVCRAMMGFNGVNTCRNNRFITWPISAKTTHFVFEFVTYISF